MKNIWLVIQREYLTRVRKKSFLVLTFLMPILSVGLFSLIGYLTATSSEEKQVIVVDASGLFAGKFEDTEKLKFNKNASLDSAKKQLIQKKADIVVSIPATILADPKALKLYAEKTVGMEIKGRIERIVQNEIRNIKLRAAGIDQKILESVDVEVDSDTISLSDEGEKKSSTGLAMGIGMLCVVLMFSTVMGFGMQVMRGVVEEKTNRIIEVIISSVKPFQLMLGKILGVGLVGLTQFSLWILLSIAISTVTGSLLFKDKIQQQVQAQTQQMGKIEAKDIKKMEQVQQNMVGEIMTQAASLNLSQIIGCFLLFFFGGYLFYSAMMGAIGSMVDNETDTQQFMFPIMLPLMAAYIFSMMTAQDPTSKIAFWASMVPFTSPIVMMVRLPFGVETWEIVLSLSILLISTVGMIWLAARIYRVGILMYGKKATPKEIWKWLWY